MNALGIITIILMVSLIIFSIFCGFFFKPKEDYDHFHLSQETAIISLCLFAFTTLFLVFGLTISYKNVSNTYEIAQFSYEEKSETTATNFTFTVLLKEDDDLLTRKTFKVRNNDSLKYDFIDNDEVQKITITKEINIFGTDVGDGVVYILSIPKELIQ